MSFLVGLHRVDDRWWLQNPVNWPLGAKVVATANICVVTVCMYAGSSFWSVCVDRVVDEFGVAEVVAHVG